MSDAAAIWLLFGLALVAANLPWLSERPLFLLPVPPRGKREWIRLLEWLLMFGLVGLAGAALEQRTQGQLQDQDWEFWVIVLCLFAVFALPGFIYHHDLRRHLRKRRRGR
ncbi:DUF2818 family protein [Sediminicurvatus halobius]|uniref:DUF2818 domain-containing protein n=1 Tax=Sediminicurvatus halobius TaxID=2182432 RepID=A0A2U2MYE3_9GAMM|nr:DUF2818 family protein [Spiribacter halobius]PWG61724.1 DUF2818 domain-containing protein [Spiribacter halobius]UEX76850.1 DUF2818 family protein [Spiribacter halobius]